MKKALAFILLTYGFVQQASAQAEEDAGLWTTINVEKKLSSKTSLLLTEEFRLRENFSRINLFYTDVGVNYRPYKFLKVEFSYRFIQKYLITDFFSYRHRLMLDITLRDKFGNFAVSYRQRLQSEVRNVYSSESGAVPEWYSRNKFEVKYDLQKKYTPYVATEFRYQIHNPRIIETDGLWHRARYILGVDYDLDKRNTFGLYYLIQREWNVTSPQDLYIIGVEYTLSL